MGKIGASKQKKLCGKNRLTFSDNARKIGTGLHEPNHTTGPKHVTWLVLLVKDSSATAECVFMILLSTFSTAQ